MRNHPLAKVHPFTYDPRLDRIYYTSCEELPDSVKMHPVPAQRIFMATFNNLLKNMGPDNVERAMMGAHRALHNKLAAMKRARESARPMTIDEVTVKRDRPTPFVVVPGKVG
jgi:hypothetical protein